MPGILLILGLLGTFLGLGIALNKASTILLEANAGGGMDNAMANLMGMMEGLGTKFKTSTWGIMAFLLIKAWSARNGYEERRLRWCVGKMKAAFEYSRQAQLQERQQTQHALIEALGRIDQTLVNQWQAQHALLDTQCKLNKHAGITLVATHKAVQDLQQALVPEVRTLHASHEQARDTLLETVNNLQQHGLTLGATHTAVQELQQALVPEVQALKSSSELALDTLRDSASALQQSNEGQQLQLKATRTAQKSLEQIEASLSNLSAISEAATQMASAASDPAHTIATQRFLPTMRSRKRPYAAASLSSARLWKVRRGLRKASQARPGISTSATTSAPTSAAPTAYAIGENSLYSMRWKANRGR